MEVARVNQGSMGGGLPSSMEKKDANIGGERTLDTSQVILSRALLTYEPGLLIPLLQPLLSHLWRDESNSSTRVHWWFRRSGMFENCLLGIC